MCFQGNLLIAEKAKGKDKRSYDLYTVSHLSSFLVLQEACLPSRLNWSSGSFFFLNAFLPPEGKFRD